MRGPVCAVAVVALAAPLAACGERGGGSEQAGADAAQIESALRASARGDAGRIKGVIRESAYSDDPADCTRLHTRRFLERSTGLRGRAAVSECERVAADEELAEDPRSVEIRKVDVVANSATAEVAITGSALDGQVVEISLVVERGRWKLDAFDRFVELDRERLIDGIRDQARAFMAALPIREEVLVDCLVDALEGLSDGDLEAMAIGEDQERTARITKACLRQLEASQSL